MGPYSRARQQAEAALVAHPEAKDVLDTDLSPFSCAEVVFEAGLRRQLDRGGMMQLVDAVLFYLGFDMSETAEFERRFRRRLSQLIREARQSGNPSPPDPAP